MFTNTLTEVSAAERDCRQMAIQHPTPNVLRGVALAEAGRVSWVQLAAVFADALAAGLAAVQ